MLLYVFLVTYKSLYEARDKLGSRHFGSVREGTQNGMLAADRKPSTLTGASEQLPFPTGAVENSPTAK